MRILLLTHLIAMGFWLGSQLFMIAIMAPVARKFSPEQRRDVYAKVGQQYGMVIVPVLLLVLITGFFLAQEMSMFTANNDAFNNKMLAVTIVLIGTVVHVVASRKRKLRLSRAATAVTLLATLAAVWFATGF